MKTLQVFIGIAALYFVLSPSLSVAKEAISAARKPGVSYLTHLSPKPFSSASEWGHSVEGSARIYKTEQRFKAALRERPIPHHNWVDFENAFLWIREVRFLSTSSHPHFQRRITWLYPDDGCYARSEMAIRKLKELEFTGLMKIFVFGDLEAKTTHALSGDVHWWFHVAPMVKVGNEFYVIDPAIESESSLTVTQWLERMSVDYATARISVCHESAYEPASSCLEPDYIHKEELAVHQTSFLHREWYRMIELGHNPEEILGDRPPWTRQDLEQIH